MTLRITADGWRFIYYAEAPKSTLAYMQDLYANMASSEFKARFPSATKLTDPPPTSKPEESSK